MSDEKTTTINIKFNAYIITIHCQPINIKKQFFTLLYLSTKNSTYENDFNKLLKLFNNWTTSALKRSLYKVCWPWPTHKSCLRYRFVPLIGAGPLTHRLLWPDREIRQFSCSQHVPLSMLLLRNGIWRPLR